jgi:hypothetical protein
VRNRPPLRPDVPCETQQPPDLRSIAKGPPQAVDTSGLPSARREERAQSVAVDVMRRGLRRDGSDTEVSDRPITLREIRGIAARNGLTKQLQRTLRGGGR